MLQVATFGDRFHPVANLPQSSVFLAWLMRCTWKKDIEIEWNQQIKRDKKEKFLCTISQMLISLQIDFPLGPCEQHSSSGPSQTRALCVSSHGGFEAFSGALWGIPWLHLAFAARTEERYLNRLYQSWERPLGDLLGPNWLKIISNSI